MQSSVVYICKADTPNVIENHPRYIGLTENTFEDRFYRHENSFKYESKRKAVYFISSEDPYVKVKLLVTIRWIFLVIWCCNFYSFLLLLLYFPTSIEHFKLHSGFLIFIYMYIYIYIFIYTWILSKKKISFFQNH